MSRIEKIIIFRALKLGDMLCSIPTLRAIRKTYPHAHIALAAHPQLASLLSRYPHYIDEFIPFAGFPGMAESPLDPLGVWETIRVIQKKSFDLAIQLHGSGEISNLVVALFNAKHSIGYYRVNHFRGGQHYKIYSDDLHEVERCLGVLSLLPETSFVDDKSLEFPLKKSDFEELTQYEDISTLHLRPYVCLHPGASSEDKRWSPEQFALLADWLYEEGVNIVFTGSRFESELVRSIQKRMTHPSYDFASHHLALGPLAALMQMSRGIICNDTGVSHLAVAIKVPSIVIFIQTDPQRWAPQNHHLHQWIWNPDLTDLKQLSKKFLLKEMAI